MLAEARIIAKSGKSGWFLILEPPLMCVTPGPNLLNIMKSMTGHR